MYTVERKLGALVEVVVLVLVVETVDVVVDVDVVGDVVVVLVERDVVVVLVLGDVVVLVVGEVVFDVVVVLVLGEVVPDVVVVDELLGMVLPGAEVVVVNVDGTTGGPQAAMPSETVAISRTIRTLVAKVARIDTPVSVLRELDTTMSDPA